MFRRPSFMLNGRETEWERALCKFRRLFHKSQVLNSKSSLRKDYFVGREFINGVPENVDCFYVQE